MRRKLGRVLFTRWVALILAIGIFGTCTTGCFFERGGHWHHHDRW